MSDEPNQPDGKWPNWGTIAAVILATYIISGFTLMTLEGIGRLNPILGRALLPIFYPFLWLVWSVPKWHGVFDAYVKWLQTFR
jgi:hypothetical protein